jgi:Transposase DDE domain
MRSWRSWTSRCPAGALGQRPAQSHRRAIGLATNRYAGCSTDALKSGLTRARKRTRGVASVYGLDGTTVRVPDSPENRDHFGALSSARGIGGYPLARIVTLMALRTHLIAAMRLGPCRVAEAALAKPIWAQIPDNALVIGDRLFFDISVLVPLAAHGVRRHWLIRAKSDLNPRVVKRLGEGDDLVEFKVRHAARQREPSLPDSFVARSICYQRRGFPPQMLLTSMLDPVAYPARDIAALYHERWDTELGYGEVKMHMLERYEAIRSRKPRGVAQELWGVGLAYNLVRLEMIRIAKEAALRPNRISFVMALNLIRDEWTWCAVTSPGAIPRRLKKLRADIARYVLPPRRTGRSHPRAVKIKLSPYPRNRSVAK